MASYYSTGRVSHGNSRVQYHESQCSHYLFLGIIVLVILFALVIIILVFVLHIVVLQGRRIVVVVAGGVVRVAIVTPRTICVLLPLHAFLGQLLHHFDELSSIVLEQVVGNGEDSA
jgi:hypothetical protein